MTSAIFMNDSSSSWVKGQLCPPEFLGFPAALEVLVLPGDPEEQKEQVRC